MRAVKWIVAVIAITMLAACGQQDTATSPKEEIKSAVTDMQKASQTMVSSIKDYTVEQRDALQKQVQEQINSLSKKISDLQSRAENSTDEIKTNLQQTTADLNQKLDTAKAKMGKLQNATSDTWEGIKGELSAAIQDVQDAYNKATSRLQ